MSKRILVVDDHESIRWCVCEALTKQGYQVDTAADTEEACTALDENEYDIVISDLVMPGEVNGLDFGRILKESGTNVVTIAMSSLSAQQECADAGYSYFLCKPFSVDQLLAAVNEAVTTVLN